MLHFGQMKRFFIIWKQCVLINIEERNIVSESKIQNCFNKGLHFFLAQKIFKQEVHFNGVASSLQRKYRVMAKQVMWLLFLQLSEAKIRNKAQISRLFCVSLNHLTAVSFIASSLAPSFQLSKDLYLIFCLGGPFTYGRDKQWESLAGSRNYIILQCLVSLTSAHE